MPRLFCSRFGVKQQKESSGLAAREGDEEVSQNVFADKRTRKNRLSRSIKVLKCLSPMATLREGRLGSTKTFTEEDSVDKLNHQQKNEPSKTSRYRRIRAWGSSKTESDAMKDYLQSQGMDCGIEDLFALQSSSQKADHVGTNGLGRVDEDHQCQDDVASQLTDENTTALDHHFHHCLSISALDDVSLSQKSRTIDPGEDQPTVSTRSHSNQNAADPPAVSRSDASYYDDEVSSSSDESYHNLSRLATENTEDEAEEEVSRVGIQPFRFHIPKVVPLRCESQPPPPSPSGKSVDDQSSKAPSAAHSMESLDEQSSKAPPSPAITQSPTKLRLETLHENCESPAIEPKPDPPAAKDSDSNYSGFTSKLEEKLQQHQGPEIAVHDGCDRTAVSEITNDTCFTEPMIRSLPNPLTTSTTRIVRDTFSGRPPVFRDSSLAGHASMMARRNKSLLPGSQKEGLKSVESPKNNSPEHHSSEEEKRDFGMKDLISKFERLAKPANTFGRSSAGSKSNATENARAEHLVSPAEGLPLINGNTPSKEASTQKDKAERGFFWRSFPSGSPNDTSDTCPEEESDVEQSLDHSQEIEQTYFQYNLSTEECDMAEV